MAAPQFPKGRPAAVLLSASAPTSPDGRARLTRDGLTVMQGRFFLGLMQSKGEIPLTYTEAIKRCLAQADRRGRRMYLVRNRGHNDWSVNVSRPRGIGVRFLAIDPRLVGP